MSIAPVPDFDGVTVVEAPDSFAGSPEWAIELWKQNAEVLETHRKILEVVEELKPEVMNVVNSLQNNPMFKMFLGGKK